MTNVQALSALNLLVAAIQVGFGPFRNLALTGQGWSQTQLGIALSVGTITALACQIPGGALVDAVHRKRLVLAIALAFTGLSALLFSVNADLLPALGAVVLHAAAAAVITPAIAAVTLTTCGQASFGERLGNNAKWASLGTAGATSVIGPLAIYLGSHWVFPLTAALCLAASPVIWMIRPGSSDGDIETHAALLHPQERRRQGHRIRVLLKETHLHWFTLCTLLFHVGSAGMLPLAVNALSIRDRRKTELAVSAAILASQVVVAFLSARLGRDAECRGRRPLLLLGFAVLPVRGLLLAMFPGALPLICGQALSGVSGAVMSIMMPLVSADLTRRTGFLSLAIGLLGLAAGVGAAISTFLGGWLADHLGTAMALLILSMIGLGAFVLLCLVMPETRRSGTDCPKSPDGMLRAVGS
jgi:MFS family permease